MQTFLNQFKLTPGLLFAFDNFIYSQGVKMLGRTSGMWGSRKVGDVYTLALGERDVKVGPDGKVEVLNPLMGDRYLLTPEHAALGFSLMVVNWFWNLNSERMDDATNEAFEAVYFGLRDACAETGDRNLLRFID
jgi:hypothetical protein